MQAEEAVEIDRAALAAPGRGDGDRRPRRGSTPASPNGTIMLSPSTAPRWKMAMSSLRRVPAASAVRARNDGAQSRA